MVIAKKGRMFRGFLAIFSLLIALTTSSSAAGLFGDGADARTIALGGVEAAQGGSAIAAMNSNPAALFTASQAQFEFDLGATFVSGEFSRENEETARLRELAGFLPAAALAIPSPRNCPITFGLAVLPEMMADVAWRYRDAPGGLGGNTNYGERTHRSAILALRTSMGVAVAVTRWFSLGASVGAIYNKNRLEAPYIFQSQPVLRGFKTLLDLETSGVGVGFNVGTQFRPTTKLAFGLSYRARTVIHSEGSASGNASAQLQALGGAFAQVDPNFRYDAEVRTVLPQLVASAFEWQALPQLRLLGGVDWIEWSNSFDELVIDLSHGSNPAINSVVGSDAMTDIAPLSWRDQFVFRTGMEYAVNSHMTLRAGYSYARRAVPSETLTPLTAAIFEHKVSAGFGYRTGNYHTDLAWLWALPTSQRIGQSQLLDGEYSQASVRVSQHSAEWSAGVDF